MKLLIVTQKIDMNDDVLGFFHRWVEEFAKHCEKVTVICLYKGEYDLPKNVKVLSLGKEEGVSRLRYIARFYRYIWQERKNYDSVFVHMNQIYVILGGLLWRVWGKKIGLWYAHGHVPFSLRIAEKFVHKIFTSTKSGFRLESNKIRIMRQGIDTDEFKPQSIGKMEKKEVFRIIAVGRVSPVKDYETLIEAVEILITQGVPLNVSIIGDAGMKEQELYVSMLKKMVIKKGLEKVIHFEGAIPNKDVVAFLRKSDLLVNPSLTGSLDKVMLEAMAVGIPILTCNESMLEVLGSYQEELMFPKKDFGILAEKIKYIIALSTKERMCVDLRNIVVENHNISKFARRILSEYNSR